MANHLTTLIAVVCLCAITVEAKKCGWWFWTYDCPDFKEVCVMETEDGKVFLREYPPNTKWVSTKGDGNNFGKLFNYLSKGNVQDEKIDMTVPVINKYSTMPDGSQEETMYFYLTDPNPPAPTNSEVTVDENPGSQVYVRKFNTWVWSTNSAAQDNLSKLRGQMTGKSESGVNMRASYDEPWFLRQTMEVMMVPKEKVIFEDQKPNC